MLLDNGRACFVMPTSDIMMLVTHLLTSRNHNPTTATFSNISAIKICMLLDELNSIQTLRCYLRVADENLAKYTTFASEDEDVNVRLSKSRGFSNTPTQSLSADAKSERTFLHNRASEIERITKTSRQRGNSRSGDGVAALAIDRQCVVYSYPEYFERLGSARTGFIEVTVVPIERLDFCTICDCWKPVSGEMLESIRKWCFATYESQGFIEKEGPAARLSQKLREFCMSRERSPKGKEQERVFL